MEVSGGVPSWNSSIGGGYGNGYSGGGGYGGGYGNGYGYGDSYGYGYGGGNGNGKGYGCGYVDGGGSGYGDGSYWRACLSAFLRKLSQAQQQRAAELEAQGAKLAYWRSDAQGRACNGGANKPVAAGAVEKSDGPLALCSSGTLHATLIPPEWKGERWWIVALIGDVVGDNKKMGALQREIVGECV